MEVKVGKYKVEVTKDDIENGLKNHATCCPIALAVCRALGLKSEEELVEVGDDHIDLLRFYDLSFYFNNEDELEEFVTRFDAEELVFPFSFDLSVVDDN